MTRITREAESRIHEEREIFDMEYMSPFDVPPEVKKDGYSYRWVRWHAKGAQDGRIEEAARQGYTPVPIERSPKHFNFDPLGLNPLATKHICFKDTVLMERPNIFSQREVKRDREFTESRTKALQGVTSDVGNIIKPINSINSF